MSKAIQAAAIAAATTFILSAAAQVPADFGASAMLNGKGPAIDHYASSVFFAMTMCETAFRITLLSQDAPAEGLPKRDYRECIQRMQPALTELHRKASAATKSQQSRAALKEHFVQATLALDGIKPGIDESQMDYRRRQQQLKGKVDEAWVRFRLAGQ